MAKLALCLPAFTIPAIAPRCNRSTTPSYSPAVDRQVPAAVLLSLPYFTDLQCSRVSTGHELPCTPFFFFWWVRYKR